MQQGCPRQNACSSSPPARRALLQRDRGNAVPYFNPEEHISQKREWSRRYTQQELGAAGAAGGEDRLYEHFAVVVSERPHQAAASQALACRQTWEEFCRRDVAPPLRTPPAHALVASAAPTDDVPAAAHAVSRAFPPT